MTRSNQEILVNQDSIRSAARDLLCTTCGVDPSELVLDSHLEGELGLQGDSLEHLLDALRAQFRLPGLRLTRRVATLRELLDAVGELAGQSSAATHDGANAAEAGGANAGDGSVKTRVLDIFRHHTHYALEDLRVDAELEAELGVDSVLLASIVADVAKRFALDRTRLKPLALRTLADLIDVVEPTCEPPPRDPLPGEHATSRGEPARAGVQRGSNLAGPRPDSDALAPGMRAPDCQTPTVDTADTRSLRDFVEEPSRDLFAKVRSFDSFFQKRLREQLYWYGMPLESACRNRVVIYDDVAGRRREYLMFASNNYLGLANHPRVIEAICAAAQSYGATNTGCRLIGGTNVIHKHLERRLAEFKGREACILYPSGYSANLGAISALAKASDAVLIDKYNHMSIVDGCKLSGAARRIYRHNDMADLERVLERTAQQVDGMLIVTDGVFSMHGDICNLSALCRLARRFGAKTLVDDAHSTGVLGARGSGTAEHFGLKGEVDLEVGTLSKALAGLGGFVAADRDVVEYLRFYSNSYVFAANIPAATAAGLIAALDVMEAEPERIRTLWSNIDYLKQQLTAAGFDLGDSKSAILPIVIGDDALTLSMGRAVRARGLFCQTVVYPGVAEGEARLRVSVSCEHTREDLDLAIQIFSEAAREVKLNTRKGVGVRRSEEKHDSAALHS
jgi:8-amino-7-oxononanoate synthase